MEHYAAGKVKAVRSTHITMETKKAGALNSLVCRFAQLLLKLRYRITIRGVPEVLEKGDSGILVLPNHPALIDPPILVTALYPKFRLRPLADATQIHRPVIHWFSKRINTFPIVDINKTGREGSENVQQALGRIADALRRGDNILLYPSGGVLHTRHEEIGANSAVATILSNVPDVRVVLVRTTGLWGSRFSWSSGREPAVLPVLLKGAGILLANGIVFTPRRDVAIELAEPDTFPKTGSRREINSFLEAFYNENSTPNTRVPFFFWQGRAPQALPEPARPRFSGDPSSISESLRRIVFDHLGELSGVTSIKGEDRLSYDIGLDSMAKAELLLWIENEFGGMQTDPEAFQTVNDVLFAASGRTVTTGREELKPVPGRWFTNQRFTAPLASPQGNTITEAFLAQARSAPDRVILADQRSGVKTYRNLVTGLLVLKKEFERLPGSYIGIMFPAGIAASLTYLAALFAGKTPVMINWTVGLRNIRHALDLLPVERVITARELVTRLQKTGIDFSEIEDVFFYLEKAAGEIGLSTKLKAALKARLSWKELDHAKPPDKAVVLFTSGSESLPKAVPLTHENILANLRDLIDCVNLKQNDTLLGMLPPFHSLGLTTTILLPLCLGLPVAYHPNPTEGVIIAKMIAAYRATLVVGTPSFLNGITRSAENGQLASLRIAVTGAEKCSQSVYSLMERRCPDMLVLEGYGITECSPVVSVNREENPKAETIGHVLPSLQYAIVNEATSERVPAGERGMLLVRGPSIFHGYLNYEGPSPFVTFEGRKWYKTGDLVTEDECGRLTFSGRLKRFVKIGGEMISLPAIEETLNKEFASDEEEGPVLAVDAVGEAEHTEIILATTKAITREHANQAIRNAGFSPLYTIRRVVGIDELPVLGTGKTNYRRLKEIISQPRA